MQPETPKRRRVIPVVLFVVILAVFAAGLFGVYAVKREFGISVGQLWTFFRGDYSQIKKTGDRTNILLLGIGGGTHEGATLTDTMLVLSLNLKTHDQFILAIPRDIWVPSLADKINSAYEYGEEKTPGGGFVLAKSVVEDLTGIPIHYAALIDFAGFEKMVNIVGGIDVTIDESFTDTQYPIAGKEDDLCGGDVTYACRYETVTFTKGVEHMDGARALIYVRSRHAQGDAGTDFSRGRRQQAVLKAFKNKILQKETLTNFSKLQQLKDAAGQTIKTDIPSSEELLFAKFALGASSENIRTAALTQDIPEQNQKGLLINPPVFNYDGKWVLIPKSDNGNDQIHKFIQCEIDNQSSCDQLIL